MLQTLENPKIAVKIPFLIIEHVEVFQVCDKFSFPALAPE